MDRDFDQIDAWDYELPDELIAATPAERRDESRLLVVDAGSGEVTEEARFARIRDYLRAGDLLVFNNARVVPARVMARKSTGGRVEIFVTDLLTPSGWDEPSRKIRFRAMTRSSKALRGGQHLVSDVGAHEFVVESWDHGIAELEAVVGDQALSPMNVLDACGQMPLPPYIVKKRENESIEYAVDRERYQTVYAQKPGAVAAPTAGLHFTRELLDDLDSLGVETSFVTLHVGPGTFRPVTAERLSAHKMHEEVYEISESLRDAIGRARARGGRIVAVGTTTVRALESEMRRDEAFEPGTYRTRLFLKPGNPFRLVDAMITNFHLPRSTLLALVASFAGYDNVMNAYEYAVRKGFRFYSYGDAMFLAREPK